VAIYNGDGEEVYVFKHTGSILHAELSPDGKNAASLGFKDNKNRELLELRLWKTDDGQGPDPIDVPYHVPPQATNPQVFDPRAYAPAFSPKGDRVAVVHTRREGDGVLCWVQVYDAATGQKLFATDSVEGRWENFKVELGDPTGKDKIVQALLLVHGLCSVEFSSDGKKLITLGGWQSGVTAWDAATGKKLWTSPAPAHIPGGCVYSGDGNRVAVKLLPKISGLKDTSPRARLETGGSEVKVLDVATGKVEAVVGKNSLNGDSNIALSPDGKWMALANSSGFEVWDVARAEKRGGFEGHRDAGAIAFSPDGKRLATLSIPNPTTMGYVKLWDLTAGNELFSMKLDEVFQQIRFSPDGHRILLTGGGGTDRIVRILEGTPVGEEK
jgi:WD40 repeat protein